MPTSAAGEPVLHFEASSSAPSSASNPTKAELGTAAGLIGAAFVGFEALDAAEELA